MQCPKCWYEPTMAEVQSSPDDCPKCGINYKGFARRQEREQSAANKGPVQSTKMAPSVRDAVFHHAGAQPVVVVDLRMGFWSMVRFMVKWAIASIPALIILALLGALVIAMFSAIPTYFKYKERSEAGASLPTEQRIDVPVSTGAEFFALERGLTNDFASMRVKTIFKDGEVIFSSFLVNCADATATITASGPSLEAMSKGSERLVSIDPNTPRQYIAKHACRGAQNLHPMFM